MESSMKIDLKDELYWEQPSDDDASLPNGFFNSDPLDVNNQEEKYSSNIIILQPQTSSYESSLFVESGLSDLVTGATNDSPLPSSLFLDESDCEDLDEAESGSEEEALVVPTSSRTTQKKKKKQNLMIKLKTGYYYHCTKCSYQTKNKNGFGTHLKLHEQGSGGAACPYCDNYVDESTSRYHLPYCQGRRHFQKKIQKLVRATGTAFLKGSPGYDDDDKKPAKRPTEKVTQNKVTSPAKYTLLRQGSYKGSRSWRSYKCQKCPYQTSGLKRIQDHGELHEKGSHAVPCLDCGVYVLLRAVRRHNGACHRNPKKSELQERSADVVVPIFLGAGIL